MPGRIRVDLVTVGRLDVLSRLQQPGTQRHGFVMGRLYVVDVQVEVDLLRRSIRPLRRNMVGRKLKTQPRFSVDVDHVPIVVRCNRATQQVSPECALNRQVGGVEDDDLSGNSHAGILARTWRVSSSRSGPSTAGRENLRNPSSTGNAFLSGTVRSEWPSGTRMNLIPTRSIDCATAML
jgi:hypothetical protein